MTSTTAIRLLALIPLLLGVGELDGSTEDVRKLVTLAQTTVNNAIQEADGLIVLGEKLPDMTEMLVDE